MTVLNFVEDKLLFQEPRRDDIIGLGTKETSILTALILNSDENNYVNKSELEAQHGMCNRTWNKHWNTLVANNFIVKVPGVPKVWMVDPNIIGFRTANLKCLKQKWEELNESTS